MSQKAGDRARKSDLQLHDDSRVKATGELLKFTVKRAAGTGNVGRFMQPTSLQMRLAVDLSFHPSSLHCKMSGQFGPAAVTLLGGLVAASAAQGIATWLPDASQNWFDWIKGRRCFLLRGALHVLKCLVFEQISSGLTRRSFPLDRFSISTDADTRRYHAPELLQPSGRKNMLYDAIEWNLTTVDKEMRKGMASADANGAVTVHPAAGTTVRLYCSDMFDKARDGNDPCKGVRVTVVVNKVRRRALAV